MSIGVATETASSSFTNQTQQAECHSEMDETVAVIPARGGSTRIPRKNIRSFTGCPIIAWSIETAKSSQLFDRIVVSTDHQEIADVAHREGAEIPFIRPSVLSDDSTGVTTVVRHAVLELQKIGITISDLCLIYATAPFLQVDSLIEGRKLLHTEKCDFAVAVAMYASPI